MNVLHVGNFGENLEVGRRCGISNFAMHTTLALRRAGCTVTNWDGDYPTIYARGSRGESSHLPADATSYDVIHFTWHPITINHYGSGHWPTGFPTAGPLLSIYVTDIPPWSACPCLDVFHVRVSAEPHESLATLWCPGLVIVYPLIDWIPEQPRADDEFIVGWSGIRGDGKDLLEAVCATHGWTFNQSNPEVWLPIADEVARLRRSTVNVCWYHEQRNKSGTPSACLASHRPLLCNRSSMFDHLRGYEDEIYFGEATGHDAAELEACLLQIHADWQAGRPLKQPDRVLRDLGWQQAAGTLLAAWEEARRR